MELLAAQENLVPILGAIARALTNGPAPNRLVFAVETTEPFHVEWTALGSTAGVARLIRGETGAILIAVVDTAGAIDAAAMRSLYAQLAEKFTGDGLDAAFDWVLGCGPPLAALAYIRGEPQVGLDTLAMCLAACFFDSCRTHG